VDSGSDADAGAGISWRRVFCPVSLFFGPAFFGLAVSVVVRRNHILGSIPCIESSTDMGIFCGLGGLTSLADHLSMVSFAANTVVK
jgi:hypothetical protein